MDSSLTSRQPVGRKDSRSIYGFDNEPSAIEECDMQTNRSFKLDLKKMSRSKDVLPQINSHRHYPSVSKEKSEGQIQKLISVSKIKGVPTGKTLAETPQHNKVNGDLCLTLLPVVTIKSTQGLSIGSRSSIAKIVSLKDYSLGMPLTRPADQQDSSRRKTENLGHKVTHRSGSDAQGGGTIPQKYSGVIDQADKETKKMVDISKKYEGNSRMEHLISKFRPDNPSIEENMVESSKNTNQDTLNNKASKVAENSEGGEPGQKTKTQVDENLKISKRTISIQSRSQEPFLIVDKHDTSIKLSPGKKKKLSQVSQGVNLMSPPSPGKRNSMFHHKANLEDFIMGSSVAVPDSPVSPRRQKRVLTTFISPESVKKKSIIMPEIYAVSESGDESSATEHSKSETQMNEQKAALAYIKNDSSQELELHSSHSDEENSFGTKNPRTENELFGYERRANRIKKVITRPDWKSDQSSMRKFDPDSDDD